MGKNGGMQKMCFNRLIDIKIYDEDGFERETIRGLSQFQSDTLWQIFLREKIHCSLWIRSYKDIPRVISNKDLISIN